MPTRDLAARFRHHPPRNDGDVRAHERVRAALSQAAHVLDALVPDGREKSTALTKIEEAMMWGNAGIARGGTALDPKPVPGAGGPIAAFRREDDEVERASLKDRVDALSSGVVGYDLVKPEEAEPPYTDGLATRIAEHERELAEYKRDLAAAERGRGIAALLGHHGVKVATGTVSVGAPANVHTFLSTPAEELAAELAKNNGLAVIGTKEPAA